VLDLPGHISKMIEISGENFPISIEVPDSEMSRKEMIELAIRYHDRFPRNAVIKIPMDPREPEKAFEVMCRLRREGVKLNATLGLSTGQLIGAMETGAEYVSLFWGRCEEARGSGAEATLITALKYRETHNLKSKIIIGSIRNINQIDKAFSLGADIVTISPKLIAEWMFTERGVETVKEFNEAYRSVKEQMKLI